ncbi:MAG TPA: SAM-dependent methyltransferase [Rhodospirillaceae bacterium]|jgi:malonyl-CoA O-methyltransferase|nr:methyltransferase domain-containing protein [Alphaproteobacteria bacterium]HBH26968.1 SAM-dependent methyltransferase [Rhodospirillaceae bacterium]
MTRWTQRVAARFSRGAGTYDSASGLQADIAARLAVLLPPRAEPILPPRAERILEVGCGTGLFTRHLVARYGMGAVLPTDAAPDMAARVPGARVMNAGAPVLSGPFDLIAACMVLHWLPEPLSLARLLAPGGALLYAAPTPGALAQWRDHLERLDLPCGLIDFPDLPGAVEERVHKVVYKDGITFLRSLAATGATTPRPGYRPLPPGALLRAARAFDEEAQRGVAWRIRYGRVTAAL